MIIPELDHVTRAISNTFVKSSSVLGWFSSLCTHLHQVHVGGLHSEQLVVALVLNLTSLINRSNTTAVDGAYPAVLFQQLSSISEQTSNVFQQMLFTHC
jgi:hypothetical protein